LIADICERAGALCIVNDDPELAIEAGAHGVHVGPSDTAASDVRNAFPDLLLGGSAGDVEAANALVSAGVDYLGVGAIFDARPTKANASAPRGTDVLQDLRAQPSLATIPIVAIGGITVENARSCIEAGADGVAAIRAILGARDISAAIHSFNAALSNR
jgi:thiamine-phosphate pyrophosphorylase